jgi:hypothetical protein
MGNLDSEYPTEQQMREVYEAYKSGKPGAIAEVLRKRQEERKQAEVEFTPTPQEPQKPMAVVSVPIQQLNSLLERNAQLEDEKRSSFWHQVNESLHKPGDRLTWCIVFFVISIALTLPFLPGGAAFVLSGIIAVGWTILADKK